MTLFRHFALKDRRIVDDPYDSVIAAAIVSQPNDLPVLARVATAMQRRLRIAVRTPSLVGEQFERHSKRWSASLFHSARQQELPNRTRATAIPFG